MNKMDDYFKKQLTDHQPAEDGWNMPSDELWDNAKTHFPQPKKKRRFVFFLLPIGLILCIGAFYLTLPTTQNQTNSRTLTVKSTQPNTNDVKGSTDLNSLNKKEEKALIKASTTISQPIKRNLSSKAVKTIQSSKSLIHDNTINNTSSILNQESETNKLVTKTISAGMVESSDFSKIATKTSMRRPHFSKLLEYKPISTNKESEVNKVKAQREAILLPQLAQLKALPIPAMKFTIDEDLVSNLSDRLAFEETKPATRFPKYEFGIGSTLHLLTILGEVKSSTNKEWPEEEILLNSDRNKNLNLHINCLISPKWSLSSGVYFNRMNLNINGFTFDKVTQATIDGFVTTNLNDKINGGLTILRQKEDYNIELLNGEFLTNGDIIKIGLDVSMTLNSIQIPLILNRTWAMKRTEFFVGLGISVGYNSWTQNSARIELYRGNTLITKPYSEGVQIPDRDVSVAALFQTGINYNITKNLKLGMSAKLFLPELMPSGIEARFLYAL